MKTNSCIIGFILLLMCSMVSYAQPPPSSTPGFPSCSNNGYVLTYNSGTGLYSCQSAGSGTVTGTGTQYYLPYWSSTSGLGALAALGTSGYVLTSNGAGAIPSWQAPTGGGNVSTYGMPSQYQWAYWNSASTIGGVTVAANSPVIGSDANGKPVVTTTISGVTIQGTGASTAACFDGSKDLVNCTSLTDLAIPLASTTTPSMDGSATYGSGTTWARSDHIHPVDTSRMASTGGTNTNFLQGSSLSAATGAGSRIPGTSLTAGTIYYMASGGLTAAKSDSASTMGAICLADTTTSCMYSGVYRFSASQSWTAGQTLYVSDASAGALVSTAPNTSGHFLQKFGKALAADTILVMPSLDIGTLP